MKPKRYTQIQRIERLEKTVVKMLMMLENLNKKYDDTQKNS